MAIPEGRMSTITIEGNYLPPKDRISYPLSPYEVGPLAIEDTTLGLLYQNWSLSYDTNTGDITLTPETLGDPQVVLTVLDCVHISFTFDQAGHVTIAYSTNLSSYMYWYDTDLGTAVTTDLGPDALTPTVVLDDKRITQNTNNDILLWYTKSVGETWSLFMSLQRERFLTEYPMSTGLSAGNIRKAGMSSETRVQITLNSSAAGIPVPPIDPANLDFESGDTNWTEAAGTEWSINQNNPQTGQWNATLASSGAYSRLVNDTFFPVNGSQEITISMSAQGTVGQGINFGFEAYDASFAYLGRYQYGITVTGVWKREEWSWNVPANAAYVQIVTSSNGLIGTFHVDNFNLMS